MMSGAGSKAVKVLTCIIIFLVLAIGAFCTYVYISASKSSSSISKSDETDGDVASVSDNGSVTLVAVGDVLMHTPILNNCEQSDGTYDFTKLFSKTKDIIQSADIAICNQETIIDHDIDVDGGISMIFNSPDEIGEAEIDAGFDVIQQATNHSYDYGVDGILGTIDFWNSYKDEATMIGLNDSEESRDEICIIETNGIKIAYLNYADFLNGFSLPSDKQYLLTMMTDANMATIVDDIQRADEEADFVVVLPHWGTEDVVGEPTSSQVKWAKIFTSAGADLIIGTHPHVCENVEWVEADNGNKSLCYYSIGNFLSNQQELPEVLGAIAKVQIVKDSKGAHIDESKTGVIPVVTHNVHEGSMNNNVVAYKLSDYTEELASEHHIKEAFDSSFSKEKLDELAEEVFGDWILE